MQDFWFYFVIGWDHIISTDALDHILFIIALCAIYQLQDWKEVLILVTAFTIGHSLTLVLSVLDIIRFPDRTVEILIPCTIVITALSNLVLRNISHKGMRINYFLALFFGLIHGMGFANTIRVMLASDQSIGMGLFGFNVGLEVGQIVVVTVLLVLAYLFVSVLNVARREWVIFLSAGVFSLALAMVFERIYE
jgi:HupE / UreJ protein